MADCFKVNIISFIEYAINYIYWVSNVIKMCHITYITHRRSGCILCAFLWEGRCQRMSLLERQLVSCHIFSQFTKTLVTGKLIGLFGIDA